jgi:hypothetical protein
MIAGRKILRHMFAAVVFFSACDHAAGQDPFIELTGGKVWVKNLDAEVLYTFCRYYNTQADWKAIFPLRTKDAPATVALDGAYEVHATSVAFTPRFPFAHSVEYHATFYLEELEHNYNEVYLPRSGAGTLELLFSIAPATTEEPRVVAIFPSADVLPENLLKFHIAFNAPMTRGEVYERVILRDHEGKEIEKAFLIIDQELWDTEMKVVTILLDPGRIKRGLRPNLEMGTALKNNSSYTLTVAPGWKNMEGAMTQSKYEKIFSCASADRQLPETGQWKVKPPAQNSDPLILEMNESFDRILLPDAIRITDSKGNAVKGRTAISGNESSIRFFPDQPWRSDVYTVKVNPLLEDLAGNNLNRLFDEDVTVLKKERSEDHSFQFRFSSVSSAALHSPSGR